MDVSCNEPAHAGANFARFYGTATTKNGDLLNSVDKPGCSTGGTVMSPLDMAKFVHANYLDEMAVPADTRLGWDYARPVSGGWLYGKNGARNFDSGGSIPGNPGGSSFSEIVIFPNGMTALITANSKPPAIACPSRRSWSTPTSHP